MTCGSVVEELYKDILSRIVSQGEGGRQGEISY